MLSCWERQIVVTTSVMPGELAKALLEAGAKAVVCRAANDESRGEDKNIAAFFDAFYALLLSGRSIVKALSHAGSIFTNVLSSPLKQFL